VTENYFHEKSNSNSFEQIVLYEFINDLNLIFYNFVHLHTFRTNEPNPKYPFNLINLGLVCHLPNKHNIPLQQNATRANQTK
jgi:hypothetical protein